MAVNEGLGISVAERGAVSPVQVWVCVAVAFVIWAPIYKVWSMHV